MQNFPVKLSYKIYDSSIVAMQQICNILQRFNDCMQCHIKQNDGYLSFTNDDHRKRETTVQQILYGMRNRESVTKEWYALV